MLNPTIENNILHKYEKESSKLKRLDGKFLPNGAWTINLDEVNMGDVVIIHYETSKYIYKIAKLTAELRGAVRLLGGETKLIVPLEHWERVKK